MFSSSDYSRVRMFKKANAQGHTVLRVENFPVFRSGTFRDSMGIQHTWESLHIDQMVAHFNLLKNRNIFADVPVRKGHGSFLGDPMDTLIGYHTDVRSMSRNASHDGKEYHFLDVDFEILDPDAQEKVKSGLWRNRSSEIGSYTTNDEAEFWPVYQGFAFVDIPAVEGLREFSNSKGVGSAFSICFEESKEAPSVGEEVKPEGAPTEGQPTETNPTPQPVVTPVTEPVTEPVTQPEEGEEEKEAAVEKPAATVPAQHGISGRSFSFKIGGAQTSDYAAVQRHIEGLEQFQRETLETGRKNFVNSLAKDNKIAATQIESLTEFALGLNDKQYEQWAKTYEAAPALPVFAQHGQQARTGDNTNEALEVAREIVKRHRQSGMSEEQIQATASWKRLQELSK
jgi:hypothetical protein